MSGRLVGAIVMLEGIAFLAIITAAITSTFVARAQRERHLTEETDLARIEARLDELTNSMTSIKELLIQGAGPTRANMAPDKDG
jgi:voltage-gated potassium channel